MRSKPRIAFVLDALPSLGGAEKVLFTALEAYPAADVFTLIYNRSIFNSTPLARRKVRTSYLDRIPFAKKYHRLFLPLMPHAIESLDLHGYDRIVSFNYAVAHGVRPPGSARHVAYTYTPMRYAWTDVNLDGTHDRKNWLVDRLLTAFRAWDVRAAARVHELAGISQAVVERVRCAWGRESRLIYPPVEVERFRPQAERQSYYLTVSRLVPHKRIDILVQAFSRLQLPLLVVGDGPELNRLRKLAGSTVQVLGYQSDAQTAKLLGEARAFVCAAEEDFGIAIVEAQASGCPVLAYGKGGALDTVREGSTGCFFPEQSVESVLKAVLEFETRIRCFDRVQIAQAARRFGKDRFLDELRAFVESAAA